MVCCHDDNTASRKTILKNGGVLEGIAYQEQSGKNFEKYWIDLEAESNKMTQNR